MKPFGCTLDEGGLLGRLSEFETLFRRALLRRDVTPTQATWTFGWSPEVEAAVRDLAASESACCSFFELAIGRVGDELVWTVTVPPSQTAALDALDAIAVRARATRGDSPPGS